MENSTDRLYAAKVINIDGKQRSAQAMHEFDMLASLSSTHRHYRGSIPVTNEIHTSNGIVSHNSMYGNLLGSFILRIQYKF